MNGPQRLGVGVGSLLASESLDNIDEPIKGIFLLLFIKIKIKRKSNDFFFRMRCKSINIDLYGRINPKWPSFTQYFLHRVRVTMNPIYMYTLSKPTPTPPYLIRRFYLDPIRWEPIPYLPSVVLDTSLGPSSPLFLLFLSLNLGGLASDFASTCQGSVNLEKGEMD